MTLLLKEKNRFSTRRQVGNHIIPPCCFLGNRMVKEAPFPSEPTACIVPPCLSTIRLQRANPKPVPSYLSFGCSRTKLWKILFASPSPKPTPLSATFISTISLASVWKRCDSMVTTRLTPALENFNALFTKL